MSHSRVSRLSVLLVCFALAVISSEVVQCFLKGIHLPFRDTGNVWRRCWFSQRGGGQVRVRVSHQAGRQQGHCPSSHKAQAGPHSKAFSSPGWGQGCRGETWLRSHFSFVESLIICSPSLLWNKFTVYFTGDACLMYHTYIFPEKL